MRYLSTSEEWKPPSTFRNLAGHRNGRLTAIEPVGIHSGGHVLWRCKCDCGGQAVVQSNNLTRTAGTRSCGCLRREASAKRRNRDGVWNEGKSYAAGPEDRCYKNTRAWSKAVIRYYGDKCERCGWNEARCDTHHRIPKSQGGQHTVANGVVLCPNCHRVEHQRRQK